MKKTTGSGIDAYIAGCQPDVRPILKRIRATVRRAAPRAEERISYRMPAFFQDGVLLYYAAFKNHIGIYPPVADKTLKPQIAKYAGPKGNLKFPLDEPFPYGLLTKIVKSRLKENAARRRSAGPRSG
jgi:uncharacterized protein YdhG (YjbR/CyaY superfamily)